MAKYVTTIASPRTPQEAFEYMADLRNFAEWDPSIERVDQVSGDGGGPAAEFDVHMDAPIGTMTLRYRTTAYDAPRRITAQASNWLLASIDTVTVEPDGDGSLVTYDADVQLNGPLRLADRLFQKQFDKIGDRANQGLLRALHGTQR
jgi:carbon monoxide dehydrogenase subunit G